MSSQHDHSDGELKQALARKGSFVGTMKAVAWSFFGVRKSSDYERDVHQLNPVHRAVRRGAGRARQVHHQQRCRDVRRVREPQDSKT